MTLGTTANTITVEGNGATTAFAYPFLMPAASDAQVIVTDSTGVQTLLNAPQYAISGIGVSTGGTVIYPLSGSPLSSGETITISRVLPEIQGTSVSAQGPTFTAIEGALDYLTMLIQQVQSFTDRAIVVPVGDPQIGLPLQLPGAAARANGSLGFSVTGAPIIIPPVTILIPSAFVGAVSFLNFGGVADGVTDNVTAFNSMKTALSALTGGAVVIFPPGKYLFSTAVTLTLANEIFNLQLCGYGATLYWPNAAGGMTIAYTSPANRVSMCGFRITTGQAGGGTGLALTQSSPLNAYALSSFYDLLFCGDDNAGSEGTDYWSTGFSITNVSGVQMHDCAFWGESTYSMTGVSIVGTGSTVGYSIQDSFTRCLFFSVGAGVLIGSYTQGITLSQCFITISKNGVVVLPGSLGDLEDLMIADCDIECTNTCIAIETAYPFTFVENCLLVGGQGGTANVTALWVDYSGGTTITGNQITNQGSGGSQGVYIQNAGAETTIIGNRFLSSPVGINIGSGVQGVMVTGNTFNGNSVNVSYNGSNCLIDNNLEISAKGTAPSVSAPAVPSSGAVTTNNTGTNISIAIQGGTSVTISIDSQLVSFGSNGGLFPVKAGAQFVMAYMSAPTWAWMQL